MLWSLHTIDELHPVETKVVGDLNQEQESDTSTQSIEIVRGDEIGHDSGFDTQNNLHGIR